MRNSIKIVLGITGPNGAGKGEICKYLSKKGFLVTSLSDILRKKAKEQNLPLTRETLISLGNTLRLRYGGNILAKWLIKDILKVNRKKIVVDSIRTVKEILEFKKMFDSKFVLIHISAPKRLRYKFIRSRNRPGDPTSYKKFLEIEKKECSKKSVQQQIHKCKELSDFFIRNNSTLENLYNQVENILYNLGIN